MPDLLEIGRVDRPHGLRGEVVVDLVTNRTERLEPGSRLVAVPPGGDRRDLVVVAARPLKRRYIVLFETFLTREDADALHGSILLAEPLAPAESAFYVHELIGSRVVDSGGVERGTVTGVEANPASDLLVVDDKWYVPARFVTEQRAGELVVDAPEGLFE